jgi:AcrR family transcriptional regulator
MPRQGHNRLGVVEEAGRLVDEEGLEALTLTRLAERLGVRPPSLFNHVANLADLYRMLALKSSAELADALEAAYTSTTSQGRIASTLGAFRRYIKAHPGQYAAGFRVTREEAFKDPDFRREEGRILELCLRVLADEGIEGDAALHAVRGLRALAHGFAGLEVAGGFGLPYDVEESFARLVRVFVAGLGAGMAGGPFPPRGDPAGS